MLNQHRLACFNTAYMPRSGAWLNAVPSAAVVVVVVVESPQAPEDDSQLR